MTLWARYADWTCSIHVGAEWHTIRQGRLGSRFLLWEKPGDRHVMHYGTMIEFESNHRFAWRAPFSEWNKVWIGNDMRLYPRADGGSHAYHVLTVDMPKEYLAVFGGFGRLPGCDIEFETFHLGPTFIKFGQVASTRPDLVPPAFNEPLRRLQEGVPPFPFEQVQQIIEEELSRPVKELFQIFDRQPTASASLSQVHFATLNDGTQVAVKVQRPGIRYTIEQDLTILSWPARQISALYPSVRNLRPVAAVEEFGRWTLRELDFRLEGQNLDEFCRKFSNSSDFHFPEVYWDYTTPNVLTMERVSGMRVHQVVSNLKPHERN